MVISLVLAILVVITCCSNAFVVRPLVTKTRADVPFAVAGRSSTGNDDITFLFESDDDDDDVPAPPKKKSRWESLNPRIKGRIIKQGQERAIANKKTREPLQDKKRKMMMFMKKAQRDKKFAARVTRPLGFDERTPLSDITPGTQMNGTVISLTPYGAYVDVGTECDGLLHISQLSTGTFIEHPRQVLSPGDEIDVTVRSRSPEKKKLHLTMLPKDVLDSEQEDDSEERLPLEDLQIDDELWGQLKRVTAYGAYVEVGAVVDGWLHFMDHPEWVAGQVPGEFMTPGDRVRIWVSDLDLQQRRLKLTANRPTHLAGPRRELC